MGRIIRMAPGFLLGMACSRETWRNADLQVDIEGSLPADASQVRICVEAQGARTVGAGGDRYALPGLWPDQVALVTVEALYDPTPSDSGTDSDSKQEIPDSVVISRAGPVSLDAATSRVVVAPLSFDLEDSTGKNLPCTATGTFVPGDQESWLLAARYLD